MDASRPSPVPLSPEAAAQALFGRVLAQVRLGMRMRSAVQSQD